MTQKYPTANLKIENAKSFNRAFSSDKEITIIRNRGLRNRGGFRWVAPSEEGIIAMCYGKVGGKFSGISSFRTEATGISSDLIVFGKIQAILTDDENVPLDGL